MTRFLCAALAVALAAPLAGCDLTTDNGVVTGPTVQFGASSLTAPEGQTATIPVTLTGAAPGQTVSVDVLFAAASSSACGEGGTGVCALTSDDDTTTVDFEGFGQSSTNGNRVQAVSITADADGNGSAAIPVDVRNDGRVEPAQQAVFAIQNVPAGVNLGTNRQIALVIGTLPIATSRTFPDDASATVEGLVTRVVGRFVWVQDGTAGIVLFGGPVGTPFTDAIAAGRIKRGDRIQASGRIDIFNNLVELSFIDAFEVINANEGVPAPQTVTIPQIAANLDAYQSELLRINGVRFQETGNFAASVNYAITDPTGATFVIRLASGSDAVGTPIPQGATTFTGVLGQFRADGQLTLVNRTDLNP